MAGRDPPGKTDSPNRRAQARSNAADQAKIIYEFIQVGAYVKVSAVDVATGVEVSVTAPASAPVETMRATARRKLNYVLAKRAKGGGGGLIA
ncbi:MAG: hypothetical protein QNJ92_09240 [Alphaproteobacteria bacterium]|nr:hypothetical protein [Alphaproteobacteria bacterium]